MKLDNFVARHRELLNIYTNLTNTSECATDMDLKVSIANLCSDVIHSKCPRSIEAFNRYRDLFSLRNCEVLVRNSNKILQWLESSENSGISVVTCAMNRSENLLRALPSWLKLDEINEIVIVDWSSKIPVADSIAAEGIDDPRIKIIRVEDEERWILSYAFNVGFRCASFDKIVKLDADIILNDHFFSVNQLPDSRTFVAGNHKLAAAGQEHINGFLFVTKENLVKVGGYNEYITKYGWDDDDLYNRLTGMGLSRIDLVSESVYHIPHPDSLRVVDEDLNINTFYERMVRSPQFLIHFNRNMCAKLPPWDGALSQVPFWIKKNTFNFKLLIREKFDHVCLPQEVIEYARIFTLREVISWNCGSKIWSLNDNVFLKLIQRDVPEIKKVDLEISLVSPDKLPGSRTNYLILYFDENINNVFDELRESFFRGMLKEIRSIVDSKKLKLVVCAPSQKLPVMYERYLGDVAYISNPDVMVGMRKIEINELRSNGVSEDSWIKIHLPLADYFIANSNLKKRRLYIDAQHGLGNRLRAIGSAASIAKAEDMELVIVWEPDHHCDCQFRDLFEYDGEVISKSFLEEARQDGKVIYNYMPIEVGGKKDELIVAGSGKDIYSRSAFVLNSPSSRWKTDNEFLRSLKPVEFIQELVGSVSNSYHIALHVRMEAGVGLDKNTYDRPENWRPEDHELIHKWREKSHYINFMRRLDELLAEGGNKRQCFYLAADLQDIYREFQVRYGSQVLCLQREIYDRSAKQLMYALADAILLSRATRLLGSTWSSFSELARRLGAGNMVVEMSGTNF